jgi:hypothetical protein
MIGSIRQVSLLMVWAEPGLTDLVLLLRQSGLVVNGLSYLVRLVWFGLFFVS